MARPSPRTQGVTEEGETFQMFGTQQLEFVAPVVYGTPYQGVVQKEVGQTFKGFTTAPVQAVKSLLGLDTGTVFSQRIIAGKTGATPVGASYVPPTAMPNGNGTINGECVEDNPLCGFTELIGGEKCKCPNWFGWEDIGKERGCECEACKKGTGQCSDKVPQCDAWDLTCEGTGGLIKDPSSIWLWIKIILALIGIGVLLWLLRPLFGIAKNITD